MANLWGTLDDVFSTAFGKSSLKTTMAFNNVSVARSLANSKAVSAFNGFGRVAASDITLGDDAAKRIIKKGERVSVRGIDELNQALKQTGSFEPLKDSAMQTAYADAVESFAKHTGEGADLQSADFQKFIGREGKQGLGPLNTARGYFGDEQFGKARTKVAIAGAVGVGVAARYLSGGNLTTTAQGERNIAGIPFI